VDHQTLCLENSGHECMISLLLSRLLKVQRDCH